MDVGPEGFWTGLATLAGIGLLVATAYAAITSHREGEPRAVRIILLLGGLITFPFLLVGLTPLPGREFLSVLLLAAAAIATLAVIVPNGPPALAGDDTPRGRIDERDIMFSRNLLEPGTERFEAYYREHPSKRMPDDQFRAEPGLLTRGARLYDPVLFAAADASFTAVEQFKAIVDGPVVPQAVDLDPAQATEFLLGWARKLGAVSAGVTELQAHHLYSHVGRGPDYGKPVELDHRFAVAVTVEMDKGMVDHAPQGPIVMESAQQYLESGAIAVQMAAWMRGLGYPARAHIDGNYRVVCPLVARDAGLGEIGRMGLLMTPELGPRVRIAVVTTDMPLVVSPRERDPSVLDFCLRCKKCAETCPSRAITFEDRTEIDGVRRWQIDSEACFTLWRKMGTDCGRCVSVCPYSHPRNALHDAVRWGVKRSGLFRGAALALDDVVYGKAPEPTKLAGWLAVE